MKKLDLRKQYLKLAYEQLNPSGNDLTALEQVLKNWFCFQFNTTENDPRLLNMRTDELLVLRMMHEIKERPQVIDEVTTEFDDYEKWLQTQMGEDYKSTDQMIASQEKLEEEEKQIVESLPEKINTDFTVKGD